MFNVGGGEILLILLLALLVLGPDKLPEATRKAGRYLNEFRRMTSGFQEEFRNAIDLSGSGAATPGSSGSSDTDAVHRATDGPRLAPLADPPPPPTPAPAAASSAGAPPDPAPAAAPRPAATSGGPGAPAAGRGPELVTPPRPEAAPEGRSGSGAA